jgi:hypothetical protein
MEMSAPSAVHWLPRSLRQFAELAQQANFLLYQTSFHVFSDIFIFRMQNITGVWQILAQMARQCSNQDEGQNG